MVVGLALVVALACDKPSSDSEAKREPTSEASPPAVEPKAPEPEQQPTPSAEPDPTPPSAPTLASVAATVERVEDPSATAWAHYKAKDYAAALPYFAQASVAEPSAWKHPYNLACAAALAGDTPLVELGLREAVARDRQASASKARRDADLASVRGEPWFEPILRGEPIEAPPPAPLAGPALSKTQLEPLLAKLEAGHGVRPKVRASIAHTDDGGPIGWVLYTISSMDLCRKTGTQKACTAKLRGEPEDGDYDQTGCGHEYLVRAQLGAEPILAEPIALRVPCKIGKLRRFEADDVDADGKLELVIDVTGRQQALGMHETEIHELGRDLRILRLDGSTQLEFVVEFSISEIAPGYALTRKFELVDDNGDGHPDLLIETRDFTGIVDLEFDDALWLAEGDEEVVGPITLEVRHYLPAKDQWGR